MVGYIDGAVKLKKYFRTFTNFKEKRKTTELCEVVQYYVTVNYFIALRDLLGNFPKNS